MRTIFFEIVHIIEIDWVEEILVFNNLSVVLRSYICLIHFSDSLTPTSSEGKSNSLGLKSVEYLFELKDQIESDELSKEYELVLDDIPVNTNAKAEGPFTCSPTEYKCIQNEQCKYTQCWPKDWLPRDCQNLRVIGVNYNTSLSMWASICPSEKSKFTLDDHSDLLMKKLIDAGLGDKPIVWIAHSMGGLIVKNMLCKGKIYFKPGVSIKFAISKYTCGQISCIFLNWKPTCNYSEVTKGWHIHALCYLRFFQFAYHNSCFRNSSLFSLFRVHGFYTLIYLVMDISGRACHYQS